MGLLAQAWRAWSLADIAIAIVIIGAVVALVYVALKQFNVTIPPWVVQVFWILVVCVVVVLGIRFVAGL